MNTETKKNRLATGNLKLFAISSHDKATLQEGMFVGRSVGRSMGPSVLCQYRSDFCRVYSQLGKTSQLVHGGIERIIGKGYDFVNFQNLPVLAGGLALAMSIWAVEVGMRFSS